MSELIDRSALLGAFREYMIERFDRERCSSEESCKVCDRPCLWIRKVSEAPAVDAVPVVHGRWIEVHEHLWRRDEDGDIDTFAWEIGFHNGPVCEVCGARPCMHCTPNFEDPEKYPCDGVSFRCSECNSHQKKQTSFCPDCGANMDGERKEE